PSSPFSSPRLQLPNLIRRAAGGKPRWSGTRSGSRRLERASGATRGVTSSGTHLDSAESTAESRPADSPACSRVSPEPVERDEIGEANADGRFSAAHDLAVALDAEGVDDQVEARRQPLRVRHLEQRTLLGDVAHDAMDRRPPSRGDGGVHTGLPAAELTPFWSHCTSDGQSCTRCQTRPRCPTLKRPALPASQRTRANCRKNPADSPEVCMAPGRV